MNFQSSHNGRILSSHGPMGHWDQFIHHFHPGGGSDFGGAGIHARDLVACVALGQRKIENKNIAYINPHIDWIDRSGIGNEGLMGDGGRV